MEKQLHKRSQYDDVETWEQWVAGLISKQLPDTSAATANNAGTGLLHIYGVLKKGCWKIEEKLFEGHWECLTMRDFWRAQSVQPLRKKIDSWLDYSVYTSFDGEKITSTQESSDLTQTGVTRTTSQKLKPDAFNLEIRHDFVTIRTINYLNKW